MWFCCCSQLIACDFLYRGVFSYFIGRKDLISLEQVSFLCAEIKLYSLESKPRRAREGRIHYMLSFISKQQSRTTFLFINNCPFVSSLWTHQVIFLYMFKGRCSKTSALYLCQDTEIFLNIKIILCTLNGPHWYGLYSHTLCPSLATCSDLYCH